MNTKDFLSLNDSDLQSAVGEAVKALRTDNSNNSFASLIEALSIKLADEKEQNKRIREELALVWEQG